MRDMIELLDVAMQIQLILETKPMASMKLISIV